jgi:hypothetical protein
MNATDKKEGVNEGAKSLNLEDATGKKYRNDVDVALC